MGGVKRGHLCVNQPFNKKNSYPENAYIFTQCIHCGTEAHYRLHYILDKTLFMSVLVELATGKIGLMEIMDWKLAQG